MKPFLFILISTFLAGFVTGMYIYFVSRAPDVGLPSAEPSTQNVPFEISVDAYGGCRLACPSLLIRDNGSYIYVANESDKRTGTLQNSDLTDLQSLVSHTDLAHVPQAQGACPTATDGIAYRFEIVHDGITTDVDSCVSDVSELTLFQKLEAYMTLFGDPSSNASTP